MAEGFLRALGADRFEAASAGTEASRVHPLAIRVMDEVGIDLRRHSSKTFDQFLAQPWDCVITVCDNANERCPIFPGRTTRLHWSFEDPSSAAGSEEEKLQTFRRIRDEILARIRGWITRPEACDSPGISVQGPAGTAAALRHARPAGAAPPRRHPSLPSAFE